MSSVSRRDVVFGIGALGAAGVAGASAPAHAFWPLAIRLLLGGAARSAASGVVIRGGATTVARMSVARAAASGTVRHGTARATVGAGGARAGATGATAEASGLTIVTRKGFEVSVPVGALLWSQAGGAAEQRTVDVEIENPEPVGREGSLTVTLLDADTGDIERRGSMPLRLPASGKGSLAVWRFRELPYPGQKIVRLNALGQLLESEVIYVFPDLSDARN
jgi:hypothetical protein